MIAYVMEGSITSSIYLLRSGYGILPGEISTRERPGAPFSTRLLRVMESVEDGISAPG